MIRAAKRKHAIPNPARPDKGINTSVSEKNEKHPPHKGEILTNRNTMRILAKHTLKDISKRYLENFCTICNLSLEKNLQKLNPLKSMVPVN